MATSQQPTSSPIGRDTLRIDGPRKVTGLAKYSSDFQFPGMLYAVPVEATIANGKLLTLDTREPADEHAKKQREEIEHALTESRGRVGGAGGAAARMGLNRTTLLSRMKRFGIDPRRYA